MEVRNLLYDQKEYKGQLIDAMDRFCPCRDCWHVYHFPEWHHHTGERKDYPECLTRRNQGCPDPIPEPFHVFYNSKRFQQRKKGDRFRCLRCGQIVTIGVDKCNWICVPYRNKREVKEYLRKNNIRT